MRGFHGAFATGVASQQGTLTLPVTWFRPPFWDLLMLQLLRPNSWNLPCLYWTFHLDYPLVLSRFCFPTKCLWRWEPDRRSNFFFSPPAHLCAVTYMTEISLIVTLNNQFNSNSTFSLAWFTCCLTSHSTIF